MTCAGPSRQDALFSIALLSEQCSGKLPLGAELLRGQGDSSASSSESEMHSPGCLSPLASFSTEANRPSFASRLGPVKVGAGCAACRALRKLPA